MLQTERYTNLPVRSARWLACFVIHLYVVKAAKFPLDKSFAFIFLCKVMCYIAQTKQLPAAFYSVRVVLKSVMVSHTRRSISLVTGSWLTDGRFAPCSCCYHFYALQLGLIHVWNALRVKLTAFATSNNEWFCITLWDIYSVW